MSAGFDVAAVGSAVFGAGGATPVTVNITIANNANRACIVSLYMSANTPSGFSVSIGGTTGVALTGTDSGTARTFRVMRFMVINPPTGAQTATVSFTGTADCYLSCESWYTVDQTAPFTNGTFGNNTTGAPTATPSAGAAGDASSAAVACGSVNTPTQTQLFTPAAGASEDFGGSRGATGATHAWADAFAPWVVSAVNVKEVSAGASNPPGEYLPKQGFWQAVMAR